MGESPKKRRSSLAVTTGALIAAAAISISGCGDSEKKKAGLYDDHPLEDANLSGTSSGYRGGHSSFIYIPGMWGSTSYNPSPTSSGLGPTATGGPGKVATGPGSVARGGFGSTAVSSSSGS